MERRNIAQETQGNRESVMLKMGIVNDVFRQKYTMDAFRGLLCLSKTENTLEDTSVCLIHDLAIRQDN